MNNMTKVNYYQGKEKVVYARSKKEAYTMIKRAGEDIAHLDDIKELNFKTDVIPNYDLVQLFNMRKEAKDEWAVIKQDMKNKEQ